MQYGSLYFLLNNTPQYGTFFWQLVFYWLFVCHFSWLEGVMSGTEPVGCQLCSLWLGSLWVVRVLKALLSLGWKISAPAPKRTDYLQHSTRYSFPISYLYPLIWSLAVVITLKGKLSNRFCLFRKHKQLFLFPIDNGEYGLTKSQTKELRPQGLNNYVSV